MRVAGIARREWSLLRGDPKLRILIAVVTLLVPLTVYANAREFAGLTTLFHDLQTQRNKDTEAAAAVLSGQDVERSLRVVREPTLASIVVQGSDPHLPLFWDVGPAGLRYGRSSASDAAGGLRLDVEYVFRVVIGLFALLLGLETVGGERQNSTLRPLFAQPISTASLLVGKCLANTAVLLGIVLWTVALGCGTLAIYMKAAMPLPVIGGLVISALSYLMFCFFIGVTCSSFGRRVVQAQTLALSLWLLQSVVSVPLVSAVIDAFAHPRSRADFEGELQRAYDITNREVSGRLGTEFLARVRLADWWELEKDPGEHKRIVRELEPLWREYAQRWAEDIVGRENQWYETRRRQDAVASWASTLSAGLLFHRVAGDLAGTGAISASRWHQAVIRYQSVLYEPLVGRRARPGLRVPHDDGYALFTLKRRDDLKLSDVPAFDYPTRRGAEIRPVDIARLAGQVCVGAAISGIAFGRLRRRYFEVG